MQKNDCYNRGNNNSSFISLKCYAAYQLYTHCYCTYPYSLSFFIFCAFCFYFTKSHTLINKTVLLLVTRTHYSVIQQQWQVGRQSSLSSSFSGFNHTNAYGERDIHSYKQQPSKMIILSLRKIFAIFFFIEFESEIIIWMKNLFRYVMSFKLPYLDCTIGLI